MEPLEYGSTWIWHPDWKELEPGTAGRFLHFRKHVLLAEVPSGSIRMNITADTRYKLYVNGRLVHFGPVKGDENRWFYDTVDIKPFLIKGDNQIAVHVLRFFHPTSYATSFARMPIGGLYLRIIEGDLSLNTDSTWETAVDPSTQLRVDEDYDLFLHIFERADRREDGSLVWKRAQLVGIQEDWGVSLPWRLCPRLIPSQTRDPVQFDAVHIIKSDVGEDIWQQLLHPPSQSCSIQLPAGTSHRIILGLENHMTALLSFFFSSTHGGSMIRMTYSECYEDEPYIVPFARRKDDRCNTSKGIYGPSDHYTTGGQAACSKLGYHEKEDAWEVYQPFHFRTFRYIAMQIDVCTESDLILGGIEAIKTNNPLEHKAAIRTPDDHWMEEFWDISVRTLENCMHDCDEDCPFYEQLQYPMDTRSSCLFTYLVSGDDALARQAIIQIHDSFIPSFGLLSSRSTSSGIQRQVIPAFSLYWICMVCDHYEYFADAVFTRRFLAVCDAILETFNARIDTTLGLVRGNEDNVFWDYTDWTRVWTPQGVPTALKRTKFSTYVNCLYAYTLTQSSQLLRHMKREGLAVEYSTRSAAIVAAIQEHCFDGQSFTDGLATNPIPVDEYSQHCQVWAVLCGAAAGERATHILTQALAHGDPLSQASYEGYEGPAPASEMHTSRGPNTPLLLTKPSISFSFYVARALAMAGEGEVYDRHFSDFWSPWRAQVAQNLTTWAEDAVCVRSDCHAWGSVPIYEFLAEVAGITPARPGWEVVCFKPRLQLTPRLDARVPVRDQNGVAVLHVRWGPAAPVAGAGADAAGFTVELSLEESSSEVTFEIHLPGCVLERILLTAANKYEVRVSA